MAKFINVNPTDYNTIKQQALLDFKAMLDKLDATPEKFLDPLSFKEKYTLGPTNINKQNVYITTSAYLKMLSYVFKSEKEIAWHGTVLTDFKKYPDKYFITDVFLYPQTISGTTVTTDQTKYNDWTTNLDDNTFNNMRLQGHSHVNMAVSPSAVDTTFMEDLIHTFHNGEFYIFMIMNKKQDLYFCIYDTANNILYEKEDIQVTIISDENKDFIADINTEFKEHITERTYQYNNYGGSITKIQHPTSRFNTTEPTHYYLDGRMVTAAEYHAAMQAEEESMFDYYMNRDFYNNDINSNKKKTKKETKK